MVAVTQVTEGEILPGGVDESDQAAKFEEFRASAADDGGQLVTTVYLSPTNADGTTQSRGLLQHMFACPIDQYDRNQIVDKVRQEFMGPTDTLWYIRIQVRKTGTRGLLLNQLVPVRKQMATTAQDSNDAGKPDTAIARLLIQSQTETRALLSAIVEKMTAAPAVNPIELFMLGQKQSAETFEKIIAAGARPAGGTPGAGGGLEDTLKQLMLMRQINEFIPGVTTAVSGAASGSDIAEIIKAATPLIAPGLGFLAQYLKSKGIQIPEQKQLPAPTLPAAAAAAPGIKDQSAPTAPVAPAVAPTPKADTMKEDAMLHAMRAQLGQLADAIALNPDPASVGEEILKNLPEAYDESLFTLLSSETWFDRMAAVQNKLQPHREWMTRLRNYIVESFTEEDDAANDSETPTAK